MANTYYKYYNITILQVSLELIQGHGIVKTLNVAWKSSVLVLLNFALNQHLCHYY